jgi:hypothetical protein
MQPELKEHAPRARCYRCGSDDIASLCHHCGKVMCTEHTPKVTGLDGNPLSMEFADLGLTGEQAGPYHCAEHDHVVKGGLMKFVVVGIVVAVIGILVVIGSLIPGLILLLAGAAMAFLAYRAHQGRMKDARDAQPAVPVIPDLDSARIRETLRGRIQLADNGAYTSPPEPVRGEVDVEMTLTRADRDRLEDYRRKYELVVGEPVHFGAGFAVLRGEEGLDFEFSADSGATRLPGDVGAWFRGETSQHPLFSAADGRSGEQWTARLPYVLQDACQPKNIPIWLVPSLVPASDQSTLEIDIHWVTMGDDQRQLYLSRFEQIDLVVPKEWGNVEKVTPDNNVLISDPDEEIYRTIQWKHPPVDKLGQGLTLVIRFEKQIKLVDVLRGRVQATFGGALSGVESIRFYQALGGVWRQPPEVTVKTEVFADFELSLNSIRYQDVRMVPDHKKDITNPEAVRALDADVLPGDEIGPGGPVYRPETEQFPGVIPNDLTVIRLTNDMSESGYYIKRVTENQPGGSGRANLVNRVWDIAGRLYNGVFPVDFHITLTGEEEYQGGVWAHAGNTSAAITVWGSYVDADMERKIEGVWDTIRGKVGAVMRDQRTSIPGGGGSPDPQVQEPARPVGDDRITRLQSRLDALFDALIAKTISEATYRELKAEIQAEIDSIRTESGRG